MFAVQHVQYNTESTNFMWYFVQNESNVTNTVYWDMMQCSVIEIYQRFRGTYCVCVAQHTRGQCLVRTTKRIEKFLFHIRDFFILRGNLRKMSSFLCASSFQNGIVKSKR